MREVLSTSHLSKRFGDKRALEDVCLSIEGPRIVGILGPNGAGKTTLLDIVLGLAEPSSGDVRLFGAPLAPYPRDRVGVVLQREPVLERVSVREYVELFAAIQRVPSAARGAIARAGLEARSATPVDRLSGGEAARLFLQIATLHSPDLLLLDEPTAHLDPENKLAVGEELRATGRERTVVLTTHDLAEADRLCDYLVFLVGGRVRAAGSKEELVAAVPASSRRGLGVEDAFFHFCAVRIVEGRAVPEAS